MISQSCRQSIVGYRGLFPRLLDLRFENDRRWAGDAAVLTHTPEVHHHEDQGDDGNADAMPDVRAEKRVGVDDRSAQEAETNIVVWSHAQLSAKGAFVAEKRSGARHIRADGHGPEAELIVREQIAGEREKKSEHEQYHAHVPIELARLLV